MFRFKVLLCIVSTLLVNSETLSLAADKSVSPISTQPWSEAVISVHDIDQTAEFFTKIAGYDTIWRGQESADFITHLGLNQDVKAESLVLKSPGSDYGYVRLIQFKNSARQLPTRPGARPWDTGCYTSIMMRAKGLEDIYDDAIRMGWWTETPITDLTFGTSNLKIVIFKGPQGTQVEAYERLSPPLPETFPDFERLSVPFNIMQTVKNREMTKDFFINFLGFETFFFGPPVTAQKEVQMPLGIPLNQTTTSRYQAGILYPKASEIGRVEIVEFLDLKGEDYSDQCNAPNFGVLSIKFPVDDVVKSAEELKNRGLDQSMNVSTVSLSPYGRINIFNVKSPDGANIEFYSTANDN